MKLITAFLFLVYSASSVLAVDTPAVPLLPGLYALSYTAKLERPFDNINLTAAYKYNVRIDPDLQAHKSMVSMTTTPAIAASDSLQQMGEYIPNGMLNYDPVLVSFINSTDTDPRTKFFGNKYSPVLVFQTVGADFPSCFWHGSVLPTIMFPDGTWFMKRPLYKSTNISLSVSEQIKAIDPSFAVTPAYVSAGSIAADVTKFPAGVVTVTQTLVITRIKN